MSVKQSILGVWLIERGSGRNLVSRCYSDAVKLDMDLIAPFLSATHTFIDKASNETLKTVDTETNRYVWKPMNISSLLWWFQKQLALDICVSC